METSETTDNQPGLEKLMNDFKVVVEDAENLAKATAGDVGEKVRDARARLLSSMEAAKGSFQRFESSTVAGAKATDKVIREHPYPSIGIAFGVGLLLGVLINRR